MLIAFDGHPHAFPLVFLADFFFFRFLVHIDLDQLLRPSRSIFATERLNLYCDELAELKLLRVKASSSTGVIPTGVIELFEEALEALARPRLMRSYDGAYEKLKIRVKALGSGLEEGYGYQLTPQQCQWMKLI